MAVEVYSVRKRRPLLRQMIRSMRPRSATMPPRKAPASPATTPLMKLLSSIASASEPRAWTDCNTRMRMTLSLSRPVTCSIHLSADLCPALPRASADSPSLFIPSIP